MNISQIGGEFALIDRLAQIVGADNGHVIQGIGDDAAVLKVAPEPAPYLLVTTDTMVENQHFNCSWANAKSIGRKAAESNISDIAAMGGTADWMVVSLTLPGDTDVEWVNELYQGIVNCCRRQGIIVVGGDTTKGPIVMICITLIGHVDPENLCLRSYARIGDIVAITGSLGASAAAADMLMQGHQPSAYLLEKHLDPKSRMDIAAEIAPLANAMIDISDGLAPEVLHICTNSNVGVELMTDKIVPHADVSAAAAELNCDPLDWFLCGGEDYELLFTISPENLTQLKEKNIVFQEVGRITPASAGTFLIYPGGQRVPLSGGYDHFKS